jgi:hypothetical protein
MYGAVGFMALALFGAFSQAAAQESPNGSAANRAPSFHVNTPAAPSTKEVLQGTYINSGVAGISVPANTFTPIDKLLTVVCPGTTGTCSIQADVGSKRLCFHFRQFESGLPLRGRRARSFL